MTRSEHGDLWRRDPRATPFQSPAWIEPWWTHLGGGERIDVEARDDAGRLTAALPMFVWHDHGVRRLTPVGAGHSDYCDVLIDPASPGAIDRLWAAIADIADRWDELWLPDLRCDSPLLGAVPPGWQIEDSPAETCPVLPLPSNSTLLAAMSKSRRRKIVHDHHRAERLGGVEAVLVGPDAIPEALDALFALHAARWQAVGGVGVLADPRVQAFHRAAAPALAEAGLLRLAVVRHHRRVVTVLLGLRDRSRAYSYINGVDQTVPQQSFGTLAFSAMIEAARTEGATAFDFLRGEEPYKYAWGAAPTATSHRRIWRD